MLVSIAPCMMSNAAATTDDLSVIDVGPELRAQTASKNLIDTSSSDLSSGGGSASEMPSEFVVGEKAYWLGLNDYLGKYQVKYFTLMAEGDNVEIWVAENLAYPDGDPRTTPVVTQEQVNYLLGQMETNILPSMIEYFRAPNEMTGANAALPGMLGLPADYYASEKLVVLVDNIRDEAYYDPTYPNYIAGFYSPTYEIYFDRNIITIDSHDWANRMGADATRPYLYEGIIAHEFQHLLHDDADSDEETFLNEGLADFAMKVCNYAIATEGHLEDARDLPENSLVAWEDQGGREVLSDYGLAYLWTNYLWERFGVDFIKKMFNDQRNGIESIDGLLQEKSKKLHFDEVYRDFSVAMLIDSSMMNYRYGFKTLDFGVNIGTPAEPNLEAFSTPGAPAWGTDYLWLTAKNAKAAKTAMLWFNGEDQFVKDTAWTSVDGQLWSGAGDLVDNWAIFEATGGGTLTFDTLWDMEDYWDFGFVQVSTDNGATWTSLANEYTTSDTDPNAHPKVVANVPGLTSWVEEWVTMSFDLSAYDGQNVLIGFRYVTDWATNYGGWYIDNVKVDSNTISDGTDASVFNDLTYYQPVDIDFMLTLVGIIETRWGTQYVVLPLPLNTENNYGVYPVAALLKLTQKVVLLVTYKADVGNVDYAPYQYKVGSMFDKWIVA